MIKDSADQITGFSFLLDGKNTEVDKKKSIAGVKSPNGLTSSEVTKIEDFSGTVDIVLFLDTFKAVFNPSPPARGAENEIAFSLDWVSNNSPVMDCHWFGVEKNSKLGWVMYEADRLLKCLHMGRDNLTGEIYSSKTLPIPGYKNIVERIKENPKLGKFNSFRSHRFWWTTQHMRLSISSNNDRIAINSDQHPIVQCELMNGLIASKSTGTNSEYDQRFANWINANYELLAEKFSVLKDLRRAAYYYGFAVWMKKSGLDVNLAPYVSSLPENIAPLTSPIIKSAPFRKYYKLFGVELYRDLYINGGTQFLPMIEHRSDSLDDRQLKVKTKGMLSVDIPGDVLHMQGPSFKTATLPVIPMHNMSVDYSPKVLKKISGAVNRLAQLLTPTVFQTSDSQSEEVVKELLGRKKQVAWRELMQTLVTPRRNKYLRKRLKSIGSSSDLSDELRAEAYSEIAAIESSEGNVPEEWKAAINAYKLIPEMNDYLYAFAIATHRTSDWDAALDLYYKYIDRNSLSFTCCDNIAVCLFQAGQPSEAFSWLIRAREINPADAFSYYQEYLHRTSRAEKIKVLFAYKGKGDGGIHFSGGEYMNIYTVMGDESRKMGLQQRALEYYQTSINNTPDSEIHYNAADLLGAAKVLISQGNNESNARRLLVGAAAIARPGSLHKIEIDRLLAQLRKKKI